MIIGIGVDIVKIDRLKNIAKKKGSSFLNRVFTKVELGYCDKKLNRFQHFAGKFATKEAISKALKMKWEKGLNWKQIEIINNVDGIAESKLSGQAKRLANKLGVKDINISISHCNEYAVAMAVITKEK